MIIRVLCFMLLISTGFLGTAQAAGISIINWSGKIKITGFGTLNNPDTNPNTMTIEYTIENGSQTLFDNNGPVNVTGSIIIKDFPGPGNDFPLNPSLVSHLVELGTADFLPSSPTGITTNFPAGYDPAISATQNFTLEVQNPATNIDSEILITDETFFKNIFTQEITENPMGLSSLAAQFALLDLAGNGDGIISRDFDVDIQVSPVPLPATAWLFISGFMGMIAMKRNKSI